MSNSLIIFFYFENLAVKAKKIKKSKLQTNFFIKLATTFNKLNRKVKKINFFATAQDF